MKHHFISLLLVSPLSDPPLFSPCLLSWATRWRASVLTSTCLEVCYLLLCSILISIKPFSPVLSQSIRSLCEWKINNEYSKQKTPQCLQFTELIFVWFFTDFLFFPACWFSFISISLLIASSYHLSDIEMDGSRYRKKHVQLEPVTVITVIVKLLCSICNHLTSLWIDLRGIYNVLWNKV